MAYSISRTRSPACRTKNSGHGVKNILYTFDTLCAQREQNLLFSVLKNYSLNFQLNLNATCNFW